VRSHKHLPRNESDTDGGGAPQKERGEDGRHFVELNFSGCASDFVS
jgi:hypothetical protein